MRLIAIRLNFSAFAHPLPPRPSADLQEIFDLASGAAPGSSRVVPGEHAHRLRVGAAEAGLALEDRATEPLEKTAPTDPAVFIGGTKGTPTASVLNPIALAIEKGMDDFDLRLKKLPKDLKGLRPFKKVEEAHRTLSDAHLRREYDLTLPDPPGARPRPAREAPRDYTRRPTSATSTPPARPRGRPAR